MSSLSGKTSKGTKTATFKPHGQNSAASSKVAEQVLSRKGGLSRPSTLLKPEIHKPVVITRVAPSATDALETLKYHFDHTATDPKRVQLTKHFVQLGADRATEEFMENCYYKYYGCSPWVLYLSVARYTLGLFMSHTDVIGLLNCGLMHVVSAAQIKKLLTEAIRNPPLEVNFVKQAESVSKPTRSTKKQPTLTKAQSKRDKGTKSQNSSSASEEETNDDSVSSESNSYVESLFDSKTPFITDNGSKFGSLLDIGAGSGRITQLLAPLFDSVSCTEVSDQMISSLRSKGFEAIKCSDISTIDSSRKFDVVCLFNVLDRCSHPLTLLAQIKDRLKDNNSLLVLAVPLPLRPAVEMGKKWVKPDETIAPPGCYCHITFEDGIQRLIEDVIEKAGYDVRAVSRVPYLSEGDRNRPFYVLDDSILVLSPKKIN